MRRFLAVVFLIGCVETTSLPFDVDADPGDLIIVAQHSESSISVSHFVVGEDPPPLAVQSDERMTAVRIAQADLRLAEGLAYTDVEISGERSSSAACLGQSRISPQNVYAGDLCPVPEFAQFHAEDDADLEAVRQDVELQWPGATVCPAPEPASHAWTQVDDVLWPFAALAATATGTIGLFGRQRSATWTEGAAPVPFDGLQAEVFAAFGTSDERFLVSIFSPDDESQGRVVRFDAGTVSPMPDIGMRALGFLELGPNRILVHGERKSEGNIVVPAVAECDDALDCTFLHADRLGIGRAYWDSTTFSDGTVLLQSDATVVTLDAPATIRTLTLTDERGRLLDPLDGAYFRHAQALEDRRFVACGVAGGPGGVFVGEALEGESTAHLTVVDRTTTTRCSIVPNGTGARVLFDNGHFVDVSGDGALDEIGDAYLLDDGSAARTLVHPRSSVTAAITHEDAVFVNRGSGFANVPMTGTRRAAPAGAHVLRIENAVFAITPDGWVSVLENEAVFEGVLSGHDGNITAAAYDETSGVVTVIEETEGGPLARFGSVQGRSISLAKGVALPGAPYEVASVGDARFVGITRDTKIFAFDESSAQIVALEWDDPSTQPVEAKPSEGTFCPFGSGADLFRSVSGRDGEAFVVGCAGLLMRVHAAAADPVAVRIATDRESDEVSAFDEPILGVSQRCAGEVIFAGSDKDRIRLGRGRVWSLSAGSCRDPADGRCLSDGDAEADTVPLVGLGFIRGLIHDDIGRAMVRYEYGARTAQEFDPFGIEDLIVDAAGKPGGGFAVFTRAGRWFTTTP